jgi:hypothetical protein
MADSRGCFLLVISNREALGWILTEQRMAFAPSRWKVVDALTQEDKLVLYTTRGCFRNPTRDRGRVVGTAEVTSHPQALKTAVTFDGRQFDRGCALRIDRLVPADQGPELAGLVGTLDTFPSSPSSWPTHIRRTLVPLNEHDFAVLDRSLAQADVGRKAALPSYLSKIQVRRRQSVRTA